MCHSPVSITFLLYSFSQINATKFRYPTKTKLDIRFPTISWWKFYLSNFVSCQLHFTTGLLVQPICNLLRNATHWSRKYFKPPISHRRVFNASKTQPVFHKRGKSFKNLMSRCFIPFWCSLYFNIITIEFKY